VSAPLHDAVIVGAGPAGLYAAFCLAREGLDVVLLEEHAEIGVPTHCTGLMSAETLELYKFPDDVVLNRPTVCLVASPRGSVARLESGIEEIVVVDRSAFDRALAASAVDAGVTVVTSVRADRIDVRPRFVEVSATDRTYRARAVVLATGVTYRFHRALGLGTPESVVHTAQAEIGARPAGALEIHLGRSVAPDGFVWLVPVKRGDESALKAGVLMRGDARAHLLRFLARADVAARLRTAPTEPVRRLLPVAPGSRSYGHRLLAIGDAAGLTKPVTGGGIFYSLLSAAIAGETLVEAFAAGEPDAQALSQYERRWRARLGGEIRTGEWFRHLLTRLSDAELDTFVRACASEDVQAVINQTARFNWHRSLILALLRQRGIKSTLLRSLLR
jgi:geranylgeranyl reductase family protein